MREGTDCATKSDRLHPESTVNMDSPSPKFSVEGNIPHIKLRRPHKTGPKDYPLGDEKD